VKQKTQNQPVPFEAPKMGSKVIGYILRTESAAKINLAESDKIVDYAMFNSQLIESAQGIAEAIGIDGAEQVVVAGKNIKTICKISGKTKTCVFIKT
jgi:predicted regulator of Ras-like GTPase activity (Roadblock/LC7/MglB family)